VEAAPVSDPARAGDAAVVEAPAALPTLSRKVIVWCV
jgi:hypothetical protein